MSLKVPYYRGLSELWKQRKVAPRDRRCRIANRAMRMVYQLVDGRQLWRGRGVDREYLLARLQEFNRLHATPIDQTIRDLHEAFAWLPKSAEAEPLAELARKKHRGPQRLGDLLIPLLMRLGVATTPEAELKSTVLFRLQSPFPPFRIRRETAMFADSPARDVVQYNRSPAEDNERLVPLFSTRPGTSNG